MKRCAMLLIVLALFLAACRSDLPMITRPDPTAYVLVNSAERPGDQSLLLIDPAGWATRRSVALPHSQVSRLSRDPQGRLWVGFSQLTTMLDNRVRVYSPAGDMLHELQPCQAPSAGISFAAGRAFIACSQNGFSGQVAVVSLATLAVERTIDLALPDAALLLATSAADEQAVVIVGLAVQAARPAYNVITVLDPQTLNVRAQLNAGADTDIIRIIAHGGRFYMLNSASWRQPRERANDLLMLDAGAAPRLTTLPLATSPVWGAIEGGALYSYHNPGWDAANQDDQRLVSRLDLATGAVQTWPLPPKWDAADMMMLGGQVMLAHPTGPGEAAGVYRFDPATGQLQQALAVSNPFQLPPPADETAPATGSASHS